MSSVSHSLRTVNKKPAKRSRKSALQHVTAGEAGTLSVPTCYLPFMWRRVTINNLHSKSPVSVELLRTLTPVIGYTNILHLKTGPCFYYIIVKYSLTIASVAAAWNRMRITWWRDVTNQQEFLRFVSTKLGFRDLSQYYSLTNQQLIELGGRQLLSLYGFSLLNVLKSAFPDHKWQPWRFVQCPRNYWDKLENHYTFIKSTVLANSNDLTKLYSVTWKKLRESGTSSLEKRYRTLQDMACMLFPDHEWLPWRFTSTSPNFWKDIENRRWCLHIIERERNFTSKDDWYSASIAYVASESFVLAYDIYGGSLPTLLMDSFPEHKWDPSCFTRIPSNVWNNIDYQREFLEKLKKTLQIKDNVEFGQRITRDLIEEHGGAPLLRRYKSLVHMLSTIYPEHEWHPWKLPTVPRGWWASRSNQEMFFEWLCAELNITSPDDWYQVSSITVQQYGGRSLLQMFNDDLVTMLQHFYPNHEWVPWKFTKLNRFETEESKREYAEWLFKELKLNSLEDWYNVSRTSIIKLPAGYSWLQQFGGSVAKAVLTLYPEHNWEIMRFKHTRKFWDEVVDKSGSAPADWIGRRLLASIAARYRIGNDLHEWYRVNISELPPKYRMLLNRFGGLAGALRLLYPHHEWDAAQFGRLHSKTLQNLLQKYAQRLFPEEEVIEEYETIVDWMHRPDKGKRITLDIFVRGKNLALEYQGLLHYHDIFIYGQTTGFQKRDPQKRLVCHDLGITLVDIPFWWKGDYSSFVNTIRLARPDIIQEPYGDGEPIGDGSDNAEWQRIIKARNEMAMQLTQYTDWNWNDDPSGWLITKEVPGVRVYWDGKRMLTAGGLRISLPVTFKNSLPNIMMEGFLVPSDGNVQSVIDAINSSYRKLKAESYWGKVSFAVIDTPQLRSAPFKDRIEFLKRVSLPSHTYLVEHVVCQDRNHLATLAEEALQTGSSGIIMNHPERSYISESPQAHIARKWSHAKVKFVERYPRKFALLCRQPDNQACLVECEESLYSIPPPVGSDLAIRYSGMDKDGVYLHARVDENSGN